jgi:autotransporter-associated beta strand protein
MTNDPGTIVNGQDIYSYGADGKVKAVTSSYSSSYPYVSATHVIFELPQSFWTALGNQDVASAIVSYYPFNDSLSAPDDHNNLELHPLTHPFTIGNGTQSPLVPSTDGGATWDSYDGAVTDPWTTPGGDFDAANYALITNTSFPASKGSTPFSWNIASLINNPTTRAEIEANGLLMKVNNEGIFPNNPPPPGGENDFVSFYSADYMTAMGTTNPAFLPNVQVTLPAALTWNNAGATGDGKTWDVATSQNWNNGSPAEFSQNQAVAFNDANNGNYNVTLNTAVTPASVTFANNAGNYTISGAGGIGGSASLSVTGTDKVTLSTTNTYTGPTTVTSGTLVIGAASALPGNAAVAIDGGSSPAKMQLARGAGPVTMSSLSINAAGTLDLTNNSLTINFTKGNDPSTLIRGYLQSGYNNDTWTGSGIVSSIAAGDSGLYAVGYVDGNVDAGTPAGTNQILVENTLAGDANLDGIVNFADLLVVAQNFNHTLDTHNNPIDWADGDFNYDGVVNFADLLLVAQNFNKQLSAGELDQLPGSFQAQWALAEAEVAAAQTNNVPEPAAMSLLAAGSLLLMRRARRDLTE